MVLMALIWESSPPHLCCRVTHDSYSSQPWRSPYFKTGKTLKVTSPGISGRIHSLWASRLCERLAIFPTTWPALEDGNHIDSLCSLPPSHPVPAGLSINIHRTLSPNHSLEHHHSTWPELGCPFPSRAGLPLVPKKTRSFHGPLWPLVTSGRTITFLWKLGQIASLCVSCYKAGSAQIKSMEGCSLLGSGLIRILCVT